MQAGRDRVEGKFDEWKEMQREEYWGKPEVPDENVEVKDEVDGGGKINGGENREGSEEERVVPDSGGSLEDDGS